MAKFKQFLIENDIKHAKAIAKGLEHIAFNLYKDKSDKHFKWDKTKNDFVEIKDRNYNDLTKRPKEEKLSDAIKFANELGDNWHSFSKDKETRETINTLEKLGHIEVNEFNQFRKKQLSNVDKNVRSQKEREASVALDKENKHKVDKANKDGDEKRKKEFEYLKKEYNVKQQVHSVYDNGGDTIDRYSIVLKSIGDRSGNNDMLGVGASPRSYSEFGTAKPGKHLGRKMNFVDLPDEVKKHVVSRLSDD